MFVARLIILLSVFGVFVARSQPVVQTLNSNVLQAANVLLRNMHSSQYSHRTEVDITTGKYFCDCSGLGRIILKEVAPESLKSLPIEPGFNRPRAISFYSAFTNAVTPFRQVGWMNVPTMAEAMPGDFIAWRRKVILKGDTSGHVMLIMKRPVREENGSYRVEVMDSSSTRHAEDTRGTGQSGVGVGTLWFEVDDEGKPVCYRWSDRSKKCNTVPIAIGRAAEAGAAPAKP